MGHGHRPRDRARVRRGDHLRQARGQRLTGRGEDSPPRPPSSRTRGALRAATAVSLAFVYVFGLASNPPKWEEPRRCLVTHEMIVRGDYVVPRLLGEPYRNKPPLQNWLIALFSGFDAARVGAVAARLVSLAALVAIAIALFGLGLAGRPDPLPAVVFLTMGIVVQYGRAGETDLPFAALVFGALACFEAGRRRGSPALQWTASQTLVGLGVLTKGIAPLFFYPPVLFVAWRERRERPPSWPAIAAGLLAMATPVLLWALAYSRDGSIEALGSTLSREAASRLVPDDVPEALAHVALYPLLLLRAALPWPLVFFAGLKTWRGVARDPWLLLCGATALWSVVAFLLVPGTLIRYLMPAFPCAAVLLAAVARQLPPVLLRGLVAAGLAYGCFYAVVSEARAAERNRAFPEAAARFLEAMREPLPVACDRTADRRLAWALAHGLGRPLAASALGARYVVARSDRPPSDAVPLALAAGHGVWRLP